ncbi:hypothetical protein BH10PSE2_BH10PSE2_24310 [soil metagenome]
MTDADPTPPIAASPATDAPPPLPGRPWRWMKGRSVLALAVSVVALGFAALPYVAPGVFGSQVRAYLLTHPEVLDEAVQVRDARAGEQRTTAVNAAVAANPGALRAGAGEPAFGPADAKVTVVEFFDYQCPYCKASAPDVLRLVQANPDVRFIFKEWPILDRAGRTVSHDAAQGALRAFAQGKYLPVHQALMAEPALDKASVDRILAVNGVTGGAAPSPEATRIITNIHIDALGLGIEGTPTFFINGQVSPTHDPAQLNAAIQAAKAG